MSLRHKCKIVCLIVLVFLLVGPSVPLSRGDPDPSGLNFSLTVFEDTGTAGDRSDDTKISFSGLYTAAYSWSLTSSRTRLATRFTKVGEMNKVRVCWEQGTSVSGTAYIRIETDTTSNGGFKPSGTLADADAEISVSASNLPDSEPEWCEYTFPGAVTLSESNWYWIVLKYEPSGSEFINVRGSVTGGDLPPNINLGGEYEGSWNIETDWAFVAFVIPETTHSLPLYRRTSLTTELPVAAGLNQIANLPNDVNKVYRIVMQMQPKFDDWRWAPDDGAATDYYIRDAGSTPSATDIWDSDNAARPQFILQTSAGNGAKDDVFISGDEASEWDGKSSITLTECGDLNDASDPDAAGEQGIYPYDGSQWWDTINDEIALNNWQVIEFWFKLDDDWSNNDIAELRYWQEAEGGHSNLAGLRYRLHVGVHQVDTYHSDYVNPKDTYSLTETVYAKATGVKEQIGWLSGWGNRVKLTIDSSDVDSSLSDFPVLVYLSTSSGRLNDDVSFVFDELQSDANRRKIAVTKSDGTTECYVEIEKWDDASEEAWLWVKVSGTNSVSSSTDTDLFLYYDVDHADNTNYVGDVGSTPGRNVWSNDFVGVWHFSETSGDAKDSTSYNTDGVVSGTLDYSITRIDGAYNFTTDDNVNMGDPVDGHLDFGTGSFTVSFWINIDKDTPSVFQRLLIKGSRWGGDPGYQILTDGSAPADQFRLVVRDSDSTVLAQPASFSFDTWYYVVGKLDRSDDYLRLYTNGTERASADAASIGNIDTSATFGDTDSYPMDGIMDEIQVSEVARSNAWIKASFESERDDLIDFGSEETQWLSGWGKRVKLTIDSGDVDSALSEFPVLVHLSTSSGRLNDDVSFVFDELQSDGNRKKIAVTKDDGTTQCYVEIEDWDDASEEAWLWVKVSGTNSVSSTTDTDLYLYYDADHADNTAYVGDSGSRTEVWDSNFVGVWHLNETPNDGVAGHLDSTSNNNDGTPQNFQDEGGGTTDAAGKIGGADYFAGDDDEVRLPNEIIGDSTAWTLTVWIQTESSDKQTIYGEGYDDDQYLYIDKDGTTPYVEFYLENPPYYPLFKGDINVVGTQFRHITIVQRSQTNRELFVDGVSDETNDEDSGTPSHDMASIGALRNRDWTTDWFNGTIDEVRISNTNRSTAWIKASYESERDDLIDFASEESRLCDFRYYSDWTGTPDLEYEYLGVAEDAAGGWRNSQLLDGGDPTGTWGVRVYEAGTSILMCSASFTVETVPEFPYGAAVALVIGFAFFLARRKTAMKRGKEP